MMKFNWKAFLEFLMGLFNPKPDPIPDPIPDPEPQPVEPEHIIVADLDTIPNRMRDAGIQHSNDNALWFALAFVFAFGPDGMMPDDGAGSMVPINNYPTRKRIEDWWNGEVQKVIDKLKANPKSTATIIVNDGRDRCGFRLGPATIDRFAGLSNVIEMGTIFPESEY